MRQLAVCLMAVALGACSWSKGSTTGTGDSTGSDAGVGDTGVGDDGSVTTPDAPDAGAARFDSGTTPDEGAVVRADPPPPPISGGTLIGTRDELAVAADPSRDRVWVVDTNEGSFVGGIALEAGDEPGRLVEDGSGRVHVALRSGDAVATLDVDALEVTARREVCGGPRGIAWDEADDTLHVACADGQLVSLPAAGGAPTRSLFIEPDLRDVVVDGDRLLVSTFRSAELLVLDDTGSIIEPRLRPALPEAPEFEAMTPAVAWRTAARPGGGVWMLHQAAQTASLNVEREGYVGGPCRSGISATTISSIVPGEGQSPGTFVGGQPLSVDVAVDADGDRIAVISATEDVVFGARSGVLTSATLEEEDCALSDPTGIRAEAAITAAAFAGERLVVQTREPAAVVSSDWRVEIPDATSRFDTGHALFHQVTESGSACASCHPEGRDDAHNWDFSGVMRRTQSLVGGLLGTEPFHWSGDQPDFGIVMTNTFNERMRGPELAPAEIEALADWLDAQPAPSAAAHPDAVVRGRALFEGTAGCTECHSGPKYTDNRTLDVGTGGAFQVPPLRGVGLRAPFFHDGCAETLEQVLLGCGSSGHGDGAELDEAERADLVAYLRSL